MCTFFWVCKKKTRHPAPRPHQEALVFSARLKKKIVPFQIFRAKYYWSVGGALHVWRKGVMSACWRCFGLCCGEKYAFVGSVSSHDIVMTSNQSSINGWPFFWIRADVRIFKKHNSFHLKRWKNQYNMSKYQTSSQNIHQNLLFF